MSTALKLLLTLAAFWFVFKDLSWRDIESMMREQTWLGLLVASACIILQIILGSLRWRYILVALSDTENAVITTAESFRIYYICIFFSNCLPGTIGGDGLRIWMAKSKNISFLYSFYSVVIDRLLALTAVFAILLFMSPVLAELFAFDTLPVIAVFSVATFLGAWFIIKLDFFLIRFEHIKPVEWLRQFFHCLRLLIQHPTMSFFSLVSAIFSHVFFGVCAYALAVGMGFEVPLIYFIALMPLVMLAITMPISIGGWGVREAAMVYLLAVVGVPKAAAVAISLQLGFLHIMVTLPAALLWLTHKRVIEVSKTSNENG